jgi:hypothetical protein
MPAVGIDSTKVSWRDVAAVADFFTVGFLLGFLVTFFTVGFFVVLIVGTGTTTFLVAFGFGVAFGGEGIVTFVEVGPFPFRPSITIWPSLV